MNIVIPEMYINDLQKESIIALLTRARGMHYANVDMRINGKNETFEVDWLSHAYIEDGN